MPASRPSLLWSLVSPQGVTSWLFGTMHVRDDRAHGIAAALYPYIDSAEVFVGEMDLNESPVLPESSQSLRDQFSDQVWQKMRRQLLKSYHIDIRSYDRAHPLILMSALSQRVLADDHQISLDEHLWRYARSAGKVMAGLESPEEQVAVLEAIDPAWLYPQLRRLASSPWSLRRQTTRTMRAYLSGDVHRLYRMTRSSMRRLRKPVLDDRNRIMAERIHAIHADRRAFIAVGAGHLSGRQGVLARVKRAGWSVRPVPLTGSPIL